MILLFSLEQKVLIVLSHQVYIGKWAKINQTMLRNVKLIKLAFSKRIEWLTTNLIEFGK